MKMDCFHAWKKIYLFYGLIFFWLGWVGWRLSGSSGGLSDLGAGMRELTADLRSYTEIAPNVSDQGMAVVAPAASGAVAFFYPESWARCSEGQLSQVRKVLGDRFAQIEMEAVDQNVDFTQWFAARTVKYPAWSLAGLKLTKLSLRRRKIDLCFQTVTAPSLPQLIRNLNFLPETAQITAKLRSNADFRWEVSWEETEPTDATIPLVIAAWAETMPVRNGQLSEERRPVLE